LKLPLVIVLSLLVCGCSVKQTTQVNSNKFIDIQQFFKDEVSRMSEAQTGLFKRTRMDTTTNSDSVLNPDWEKELFAFLDINIKPAVWKTDFTQVDTHDDPNETATVYTTTNPNQKVRTFKLELNPDSTIQRFTAEIIEQGKIASSVTGLSYTQNVGYTIKVDRTTKIMGSESYQIVGQFITNKKVNNK